MIEKGQVITLKIRYNNKGEVASTPHPLLVIRVKKRTIEVAHIDSITSDKRWKALLRSNVIIRKNKPFETVVDKDSFVQVDNIIELEYFPEIVKKRRQTAKLSKSQFRKVLNRYYEFKNKGLIPKSKIVYMSKKEILRLNNDLRK